MRLSRLIPPAALYFETILANVSTQLQLGTHLITLSCLQFSLPREERRNISLLYNKMTVAQMSSLAPNVSDAGRADLFHDSLPRSGPSLSFFPFLCLSFSCSLSLTRTHILFVDSPAAFRRCGASTSTSFWRLPSVTLRKSL